MRVRFTVIDLAVIITQTWAPAGFFPRVGKSGGPAASINEALIWVWRRSHRKRRMFWK